MGLSFTKLFWVSGPCCREDRIIMLGLDNAGKTTILYKLKLGKVETTIPTIGFNVESIHINNLHMCLWDVGGQDKIRCLWKHYFENATGVIFVIDATDKDRLHVAKEEFHKLLEEEELRNVPILVFANKQDHPHAMPTSLITEELKNNNDIDKQKMINNRLWTVQPCNAINGKGLIDGLEWLSETIKKIAHRYYNNT